MGRMDEKLFMLRNRKTGAWLCKVDFGKNPAEPIDADSYRAPKLFVAGECEAYCTVAGISADDYEAVPVRIVEDVGEGGADGSTRG